MIKKILKKLVNPGYILRYKNFMNRRSFPQRARKSWLSRKNTINDNHVEVYWATLNHPNRIFLADLIKEKVIPFIHSKISILEFGSHVGANIFLLDSLLKNKEVDFYCVEPNVDAVTSLKQRMPHVQILQAEDSEFLKNNFPGTKMTLSFVNAVFYCIDQKRAKNILKKITKISEIIIIGDELDNCDGKVTIQNADPYSLLHPYKNWLTEFGFHHFEVIPAPVPKTALNGFLVAYKRAE